MDGTANLITKEYRILMFGHCNTDFGKVDKLRTFQQYVEKYKFKYQLRKTSIEVHMKITYCFFFY